MFGRFPIAEWRLPRACRENCGRRLTRAARTAAVMVGLVATSAAQSTHPYVGYRVFETRRTATDERECMTQIDLLANDSLSFSYHEEVRGCIDPVVRSVDFSNTRFNVTAEEQADLVHALLAANVFDLVNDERPDSSDDYSTLDVRIGSRDERWTFWSPPTSPGRKAIHESILGFASRMGIDRPENPEAAVTVSEGDLQPAREVSLGEVLVFPEKYQGKRISVVGYYSYGFEAKKFSIAASGFDTGLESSLWRSALSSFAKAADIDDREDGWLRIDGVFLRGPTGHKGAYPGEIARVTRAQSAPPHVSSWDEPRPRGYSSWIFLMAAAPVLLLAYVTILLVRRMTRVVEAQGSQQHRPTEAGTGSRQPDRRR